MPTRMEAALTGLSELYFVKHMKMKVGGDVVGLEEGTVEDRCMK